MSKEINNYQRTANYLAKIFRFINEDYFDNKLDIPSVTIQTSRTAYGHITVGKVWDNKSIQTFELNISAEYLNRPIEETVATLIHEASHEYAILNGIKDTSNNNVYHNKKFKKIAEEIGKIKIEQAPTIGWSVTSPTDETIDFCIRHDLQEIKLARMSYYSRYVPPTTDGDEDENGNGGEATTTTPPKPKTSTRKYQCPSCGNSFRATKSIHVLCMDCNEEFLLV